MPKRIQLWPILAVTFLSVPLGLSAWADCNVNCSAGSGPCNGAGGTVSIDCGSTRCTVTVDINGNGGSGFKREEVGIGSDTPVTACITGPSGTCCVSAAPCGGSDWGDAGSSCAALCSECDQ